MTPTVSGRQRNYKLRPEDEFRSRFYGLLGRLVHAHAHLDFSVGLQLNWMGHYLGREVKNLLQATTPFTHRLAKLEELTSELFADVEPESLAELRDWFKEANRLKQLRNDYVHGRWGVPRSAIENPPLIEFVPLHWNMDPQAAAVPKVMTIDQFEQEVATLQHLASEYFRLTKKYEKWAVPRQA